VTRRVLAGAAIAAGALALALWLREPAGAGVSPALTLGGLPRPVGSSPAPVDADGAGASPDAVADVAAEWGARAADVARDCDLPVETACEGDACVALLRGPDLDGALGWLTLALSSPRFVASTALRDLGVGAGTLPCGAAIDGLLAGRGVPMIELADGTELWCATDAAGDTALCDRLARERFGAAGFGRPGVRRLSFER
jgi:hypothetical protein